MLVRLLIGQDRDLIEKRLMFVTDPYFVDGYLCHQQKSVTNINLFSTMQPPDYSYLVFKDRDLFGYFFPRLRPSVLDNS